jgi:hypothetical protein
LLLPAAFFLVGCLPSGGLHLEADPALKLRKIEQGRVALLPVLASTPLMDANDLAPARAQLMSQVARSRPTVGLVEPARVNGALGERPQLAPALG